MVRFFTRYLPFVFTFLKDLAFTFGILITLKSLSGQVERSFDNPPEKFPLINQERYEIFLSEKKFCLKLSTGHLEGTCGKRAEKNSSKVRCFTTGSLKIFTNFRFFHKKKKIFPQKVLSRK